ncbi:chorismate mutase [Chytriomyces confervae]|uniref:Chorismate mutase n=1 Tax=Chytriomyces confervae TaxID=246404 RepID=A0A507FJP9_9FUNG|nr:chorismate mutase aro7 [Chytriomyces hyalinus]TPX76629.1 chorismate mutase [Chytriomyces confervae]
MSNFHVQSPLGTPSSAALPEVPNFLSLDRIRHELVLMEDTIVFALVERAGFAQNLCIYTEGHENFKFAEPVKGSFLDYFLAEMEAVHAKVRRYTSPDEYPFTSPDKLPKPVLPPLKFPQLLCPNDININNTIKQIYVEKIIPSLCKEGDDSNYGSSSTKDIEALQVLSRRIHFGKFVAEAKFQDPKTQDEYIRLIEAKDRAGIEALLTNRAVEERLLKRLRLKAFIFGQEVDDTQTDASNLSSGMNESSWRVPGTPVTGKPPKKSRKINPDLVVHLYEQFVIPLTKDVEVEYLMGRLKYHPEFTPSF